MESVADKFLPAETMSTLIGILGWVALFIGLMIIAFLVALYIWLKWIVWSEERLERERARQLAESKARKVQERFKAGYFGGTGLLLLACLLVSCAPTITPLQVHDNAPSYDGSTRNSGFLGFDSTGLGYLTPHARDRYNQDTGLKDAGMATGFPGIPLFNKGKQTGLSPTNCFTLDGEHLTKWATVLRAKKAVLTP